MGGLCVSRGQDRGLPAEYWPSAEGRASFGAAGLGSYDFPKGPECTGQGVVDSGLLLTPSYISGVALMLLPISASNKDGHVGYCQK